MDPSDAHGGLAAQLVPLPADAERHPGSDVKPRLTKDQHDVLEHHFQQQHKPSTNVKKEFANKLGVPLDKINNWFQNRRAKVKQDRKKAINQLNMSLGMTYGHPHMPVMPGHYPSQHDLQQQHQPQPQMHLQPDFYPLNNDISPAMHPAQSTEGPPVLELTPQISLQQQQQHHQQQQQQYDMQHALRSIPEANRSTSYHPNAVMHSFMAATNGAYMDSSMPTNAHEQSFPYHNTGPTDAFSNDLTFTIPANVTQDLAPAHPEFTNFADFGIDYSSITGADADQPKSADMHQSTSSISSVPSHFSGTQPAVANTSSNGPTPPSIASVTSFYSGWTDNQPQISHSKPEDESEVPFTTPYTMIQASASEQTLPFWNETATNPIFPQQNFYQQTNASAHAILSSPDQGQSRKLSGTPVDFDLAVPFEQDAFARRCSSTSNLANNMDAVHIRNATPDDFKQSGQLSSIAARRQKRPAALNSTAMRSSSYSAPVPSPGGSNDHTLRRIRSSGIANAAGRIQKSQPGSAQRSPMVANFSEAAASPKFARAFSGSTATTVGNGVSLAPPTPLTPQDFGNHWQNNAVVRPHSTMPEHNSPDSMHLIWPSDQAGNLLAKNNSPPSKTLDLHSRFSNDALYRDTPPQSAPATQQAFPRNSYMQQPQTRVAFHSATDLTIQQPKPSHFRRPSLPDSGQSDGEDLSAQYYQGNNVNYEVYKDMSLNSIHHGIPFAPPVSSMPDFLVHQYAPPDGNDAQGNMLRRATESRAKNYIFANQGPGDFRVQ